MNGQVIESNCVDCVHCYIESDGGFMEIERTWKECKKGRSGVGKFPFINTKCDLFEKSNPKNGDWMDVVGKVKNVDCVKYPDGTTGRLEGDFVLI